MIPYSKQFIDNKDIISVNKVLKSNIISRGKNIVKFEKILKDKFESKYCAIVNNGTNALYLACKAIGIKKNDIVWTVPITFAASANAPLMCQAKIDFVDIDLNSFNISIQELQNKLIKSKNKKLPKAIIIVHLGGNPVNMSKIYSLSKKYKFKVIEDASHALGSSYKKFKIGSCRWSDICIFSFHAVKSITTSEGGALLTNKKKYFNDIRLLRENGLKSYQASEGVLNYNLITPSLNFRISEVLAALGISQIKKLWNFINSRNILANYYKKKLINFPLSIQKIEKFSISSYHLFIIVLSSKFKKKNRDKIITKLKKKKYYLNSHYKALHLTEYFKRLGYKKGDFPNSEFYSDNSISIPLFPQLKKKQIDTFLKTFKEFLNEE